MIVCIESVDKTGKTTLANKISEKTGWNSFGYRKPEWWMDLVEFYEKGLRTFDNAILDRWILSNKVYSEVLGHNHKLSTQQYNDLLTLAGDHGTILVVCWDIPEAVAHRFKADGEDFTPVDKITEIQDMFLSEARRIAEEKVLPVVLRNNFTGQSEVLYAGSSTHGIYLPSDLPSTTDEWIEGITKGAGGH